MTMFSPSLPPARLIVMRMPWFSATGGAANARSFDRYGLTAITPVPTALYCMKRRRENGLRSKMVGPDVVTCALLGEIEFRAEHQQRQQVDERPVHPRLVVRALVRQPRLELRGGVGRRAVDAEE